MTRRNADGDPAPPGPVRVLRRATLVAALLGSAALVTACASNRQNTLSPSGPGSQVAATSWWLLFGVATFVCVLVITAAILAVVVRRKAKRVRSGEGSGVVLTFGVVLPAIVFAATFALSVVGIAKNAEPDARPAATIDVIGHTWWWEVRYTGADGGAEAVTANEIHVPVGTPVHLRLQTADVIHSFWVPELMPKTDLLPNRLNDTWLTADHAGTYRGQCAEYCGLQHAHMAFEVVAEPRADFDAWLQEQSADAQQPTTADTRQGMEVFTTSSCATCHTVRGTTADGDVGPDLTHVGSRHRLAAGAIPNDVGHLSGWIANSQTVKPGNLMPPQRLSPDDLHAVVAYLESLE